MCLRKSQVGQNNGNFTRNAAVIISHAIIGFRLDGNKIHGYAIVR